MQEYNLIVDFDGVIVEFPKILIFKEYIEKIDYFINKHNIPAPYNFIYKIRIKYAKPIKENVEILKNYRFSVLTQNPENVENILLDYIRSLGLKVDKVEGTPGNRRNNSLGWILEKLNENKPVVYIVDEINNKKCNPYCAIIINNKEYKLKSGSLQELLQIL